MVFPGVLRGRPGPRLATNASRPPPSPAPALSAPASPPATAQHQPDPFGTPSSAGARARNLRGRIGGALAAAGALAAKFFSVIKGAVLLLPKLKLIASAATAFVSVAAYSLFFGWTFAVGFVVLLFVHELGHVIALRREGIKASAPMFIPFLGAVISARSLGQNVVADARVGLAGPIVGSIDSAACILVWHATGNEICRA